MADDSAIVIKIGGDPKDFEKAVEQVQSLFKGLGKTVDNESKTSSAAFASFIGNFASATALNAIGAVRDGISAVFSQLKGGITDALEADTAFKKFNLSLANTGQFTADAKDSFEEFADGIEKSTGIAEEAVLGVASKIQSFGKLTPVELQKATEAAADLSAGLGVDFETAGNLLAKASQGNVEALKKLGVQVEDTGNTSKDFSNALTQIETQFKGSAEANVKNFAGQIGLLGNAYDDTFKAFGKSITDTPALTGLASGFTGVLNGIKDAIEGNQGVIQEFVSGGVDILINSLQGLGNAVAFGFEAFGAFREIITNVNTAILAIPEAAFKVGAAFATIFAPLDAIIAAFNQLTGSNIPQIKESFQSIGDEIGAFRDFAKQDAQEFSDAQTAKADSIRNFASTTAETLRASIAEQNAITEEQRNAELERRSLQAEEAILTEQQKLDQFNISQAATLAAAQGWLTQTELAELKSQTSRLAAEGNLVKAKEALRKVDETNAKKASDLQVKIKTEEQAATFSVLNAGLSLASSLSKGKSKELFLLSKAVAAAQVIVSTQQAAALALAQPPGPPTTAPLAAAAKAQGAASLATIAASTISGFATGGVVTGGVPGIDSVPILAQQGEIVAPPKSFDEVVEGTARQRGFVQGNEQAGVIAKLDELINAIVGMPSVTVQAGTVIADDNGINELANKLRDAVQFRGATLA